jgi:hypothetical protein
MAGPVRWRRTPLLLAAALVACAGRRTITPSPTERVTEFRNGQWFDGTRFVRRPMFVVGATLEERRPSRVDTIVDLAGGYVVPPFGDAHQHLYDPSGINAFIARFVRDGIFYVKDQSSAPIARRFADPALRAAGSLEMLSANQGWTSPGGHPVEVVRRGAQAPGPIGAYVRDSLDPGIVMQVDTREDVDRRWPIFLAGSPRPDFVKVFLLVSEDYARRRAEARFEGNRGLDPALVPYIVSLAHAAGLTVSAHVYTAADFRAALAAGVDQIAHLPGGRNPDPAPFLLTDADAAAAASRHVPVITTITQHGDSAVTDRLLKEQYTQHPAAPRAQRYAPHRQRRRGRHGDDRNRGAGALGAVQQPRAAADVERGHAAGDVSEPKDRAARFRRSAPGALRRSRAYDAFTLGA